jgi:hypothetical protein
MWWLALVITMTALAAWAATAASAAVTSRDTQRVIICHALGNGSYIRIDVDDDGSFSGHKPHHRDLIPAPDGACPSNDPGSCKQHDLPCDNIPEVPNHGVALLAALLGVAGFGGIRRWRGRGR